MSKLKYKDSNGNWQSIAPSQKEFENVNTESTGYGIISGLNVSAQATPNMTVSVASGTVHMPDGKRFTPASNNALAITASDATKPRTDIVYVSDTGVISYLASALGTAAVAGSNTYTITTNFVANDTVVFGGVTFTAVASGATGNQFNIGADTTASATNLASAINANSTINATYSATSSTNVITITEKTAGGGNTPGSMTTTGTGVVSSGTATTSKVQVFPSAPSTPTGGVKLSEVKVGAGVTSIVSGNITDLRQIKQNNNQIASSLADIAIDINNYPIQVPEADDTARFKRMLADAQNKNVILKSGQNYTISDTLYPPKGCKIFGYNATITNNITTSVPVFWIQYSNCSIFDLTVQNTANNVGVNNSTTQSLYGSAVAVGYPSNTSLISNIKLENITVLQGIDGVSAIILTGLVENAHVKNCLVDGTTSTSGAGFIASYHVEWNGSTVYSPRNITFETCIAKNNTKSGSHAYYLSGGYNLSIKNCKAENVVNGIMLYAGDSGVETGKEVILSVSENQILDFTGYGIEVSGTDSTQIQKRYVGAKIDNNNIRGLSNGASAVTNGIRLYRNGGGVTITNNKIKTVNIGINSDPCKAILIDHNEFDDIWNQAVNTVQLEKSFITRNTFKDISKAENTAATDSTIVLTYLSNDNIIENNIFGYDGQTILPRFHIYIKNETTASNNSINNKIYKNTFFSTAGGYSIINGVSANSYSQINYVSENVIVGTDILFTGACVFEMQGNKKVAYHTGPPTIGTWKVGDEVRNITPAASGNMGWVCTTAGTPGTWKTYGTISA